METPTVQNMAAMVEDLLDQLEDAATKFKGIPKDRRRDYRWLSRQPMFKISKYEPVQRILRLIEKIQLHKCETMYPTTNLD